MNSDNLSRKQKAKLNIFIALLYQLVAAFTGLILPRYILQTFGSEVNGIMQSVSQFLSYTAILECGIGGMVVASFYGPLSRGDNRAVSDIFNNTKAFFTKISYVFMGLVVVLVFSVNFIVKTDFSFIYVSGLTLIMGISYYFSYYFGLSHQLLIKADQKIYVVQSVQIITLILNTVLCIVFMKLGFDIHAVKLLSAFIFLLNPVVYRLYVKKHYEISKKIYDSERKLPQKREGIIHHIAYFIHRNTDIVVISLFCGVKEVSVYSIYYAVVFGIENFLVAISTGLSGAVGNIIARGEKELLRHSFEIYEFLNTVMTTFFLTVSAITIVPFVKIYTSGITDVNYVRYIFSYILILSQWFYCVRIPYGNVTNAAGHYKETKPGAYMEALLNISVSLICVTKWGLPGVVFGTLVAMCARTVYTVLYLEKNILMIRFTKFLKSAGINLLSAVITVAAFLKYFTISTDNFFLWAIDAFKVSIIVAAVLVTVNLLINRKVFVMTLQEIKGKNSTKNL